MSPLEPYDKSEGRYELANTSADWSGLIFVATMGLLSTRTSFGRSSAHWHADSPRSRVRSRWPPSYFRKHSAASTSSRSSDIRAAVFLAAPPRPAAPASLMFCLVGDPGIASRAALVGSLATSLLVRLRRLRLFTYEDGGRSHTLLSTTSTLSDVTFATPDLTTFTRPDGFGLVLIG